MLVHRTDSGAFDHHRIDLSRFAGEQINVRFYFDTLDAVNNGFEGWFIDNVRVVSLDAVPPDAPTNVRAVAGDGEATVSWNAPASDGGSPIIEYTVVSDPGGLTAVVDGSTLSATVTGLTNGTAYTFTVTATNAAGTSDPAAPSAAVTPVGVPNPPTGVIAVAGDAEATVTWSAPASDGGSPITEYTVVSDPGGVTAVVDGATLTSTVTGLTNGIAYTFRVTATNAAGTSNPSAPSSAVTIGLPPPTVSVGADVSVDEGDAGMTAAADVIVTLSDTRTFAVSVQYETSDGDATVGGDYSGASSPSEKHGWRVFGGMMGPVQ